MYTYIYLNITLTYNFFLQPLPKQKKKIIYFKECHRNVKTIDQKSIFRYTKKTKIKYYVQKKNIETQVRRFLHALIHVEIYKYINVNIMIVESRLFVIYKWIFEYWYYN